MPEWSPDESYLTKLERLAFALVRTKPPGNLQSCDIKRRKDLDLWVEKCKGLAGPFALALLVAIPYIAENSSGSIIVASLLLAALDAALTVWCYTDFESQHGHCTGDLFTCMFNNIGEFPAFLVGWWWISAMSGAFAASAKTLSAIMDSVTGRHVDTLMENTIGSFTPLGAPLDIISVGVITIPAIMCCCYPSLKDSNFLRTAIYALTSTATLTIFGYAVASNHGPVSVEPSVPAFIPDGNLYAKIVSGAALACVGFLGLYSVSKPENLTLTQHKHFYVSKRFSLTGCVVASGAFLVYFIESTVINKVQQTPSLWDGDPPLLWPLEGLWRLIVAALAIVALSLTTFEFIIPLSIAVTKLANDGLLYKKLRKIGNQDNVQKWACTTPLVFGGISALQAMLIDTKVLLGLIASSLLCIHITVCSSMIAERYKVPKISTAHKRAGHIQTRPKRATSNSEGVTSFNGNGGRGNGSLRHPTTTRRLLAVSFLKSGLGKLPREVVHEIEVCRNGRESEDSDAHGDRACLMQDVDTSHTEPPRRESASEFSLGSNVSGYESDTDQANSEDTDDTDIDAVVTEYQEHVRVATLNGVMPMYPTPATQRRVALSLAALVPCCLALTASFNRVPMGQFTGVMLGVSSGLLTFLLLVVISRQPQRRRMYSNNNKSQNGPSSTIPTIPEEESNTSAFFEYSVIPWVPAAAVLLHSCLLIQSLDLAATPFAFWLATGLIIYFSYSVTKSVAAPSFEALTTERICLTETPRHSLISSGVTGNEPSTSEPYAQIDTLLLA